MTINFCYDDLGPNPDLGYPNLAEPALTPEEFDTTWPRVLPLRFLMYLRQFGIGFQSHLVSAAPKGSWYPIALGWHDFDCDYFSLISDSAISRIQQGEIKILFYYHEGDHPGRIKERFDALCLSHGLPEQCYLFISANSAADRYNNFCYFSDHEYFLSYINRRQSWTYADDSLREYRFTALNRTHKWWRASVMADLHHRKILDKSLWSYNTQLTDGDRPEDNPLILDVIPGWRNIIGDFLDRGPYICDTNDAGKQNDHRDINTDLYTNSYCHLVIETLFDVDQSQGSFLTEKTYKCIKFGQPFIVIGPVGSLDTLRKAGYRVFDDHIDNSYDNIVDNTERWLAVRKAINEINQQPMHEWYLKCLDDVKHNQWNFNTKNTGLLKNIVNRLTTDFDAV